MPVRGDARPYPAADRVREAAPAVVAGASVARSRPAARLVAIVRSAAEAVAAEDREQVGRRPEERPAFPRLTPAVVAELPTGADGGPLIPEAVGPVGRGVHAVLDARGRQGRRAAAPPSADAVRPAYAGQRRAVQVELEAPRVDASTGALGALGRREVAHVVRLRPGLGVAAAAAGAASRAQDLDEPVQGARRLAVGELLGRDGRPRGAAAVGPPVASAGGPLKVTGVPVAATQARGRPPVAPTTGGVVGPARSARRQHTDVGRRDVP